MSIFATPFGQLPDGTTVELFTLTNEQGLTARITNYGGIVTSLLAPDRDGQPGDVVLGYDDLAGYQADTGTYLGALVGRYANRLAAGRFTLDGKTYQLATNNGPNHLHGGVQGFDRQRWDARPELTPAGPSLLLSLTSPDGDQGYPGTVVVSVRYTLTQAQALRIEYEAHTNQATPLNLTNHSYFNLSAGRRADVLQHELQLSGTHYTVVDETLIPTGEQRPVPGTPFDFTTPHAIGARLAQVPGGYDHNYVLPGQGLRQVATVHEPLSGRTLTVLTDQPGVQLYTGNFLGGQLGKQGVRYEQHGGFCLETQHFPDSPNQRGFPNTILRPGEVFRSTTEYRLGLR